VVNKEQLKFAASNSGEDVWICGHCNQPADHAQGTQNNPDQLVLMLMCPSGKVTLGEWATEEEKAAQLVAYLTELKLAQVTHDITEHGLAVNSVKQRIRECRERERVTTDPAERARLRKDCESLENHESALLKEMRELQDERRRLTQSS
jgi:hypothetical protein